MHYVVAVRVVKRVRHLAGDLQGVADRELPLALEPRPQGLALDVGHDIVDQTVGLIRVVQRQDMGVVQPGCDLDLVEEPGGSHVGGEVGAQDLDGHGPVVLQVMGKEHLSHPALPQLTLESVASGDRSAEPLEQLCHCPVPCPRKRVNRWNSGGCANIGPKLDPARAMAESRLGTILTPGCRAAASRTGLRTLEYMCIYTYVLRVSVLASRRARRRVRSAP